MTKPTKLTLRLHPDQDADLIRWLASLDDLPFGQKGRAIKKTLRRGLGQEPETAFDAETLLTDIRDMVPCVAVNVLPHVLHRYRCTPPDVKPNRMMFFCSSPCILP